MNTESTTVELTPKGTSSYARSMATEGAVMTKNEGGTTTATAEKTKTIEGKASFEQRTKTAVAWGKYLREIKGLRIDPVRLKSLIEAGTDPKKWQKERQPGDILPELTKEKQKALRQRVSDEAKKDGKKADSKSLEQMIDQGIDPIEASETIKVIWKAVYGDTSPMPTPEQQKEITQRILSGEAPSSAVGKIILKKAWIDSLSDEELKNADTLQTVKSAVDLDIYPEITSKEKEGERAVEAKTVFTNARLSLEERVEEARKILHELADEGKAPFLTAEQEKKLAEVVEKVHNIGAGEVGKNGEPNAAGVFNYRPEHLREKVGVLKDELKLDAIQRRALIEPGVVGNNITGVTPTPGSELDTFVGEYNTEVDRRRGGPGAEDVDMGTRSLNRYIERLENLKDSGRVTGPDLVQANTTLAQLRTQLSLESASEAKTGPDRSYFKLSEEDQRRLQGDPKVVEAWVNKHFNALYRSAERSGIDPLQDKYWGELQSAMQEASRFLRSSPERSLLLNSIFEARSRNMSLAGVIGSGDTEQMKKAAQFVLATNVLLGYEIDGGKASSMAHRAEALLEDIRLEQFNRGGEQWRRGHVTPEMMASLRQRLMDEHIQLAKAGVGEYGAVWQEAQAAAIAAAAGGGDYVKEYEETKTFHVGWSDDQRREYIENMALRDEIRRVITLGLNLSKNTQREAVVSARGHELFGLDSYFSSAAALQPFNPESFLFDKWDVLNEEEQAIHDNIVKKAMVDDWLLLQAEEGHKHNLNEQQRKILGDLLFINISAAQDFASSGWRLKGTLQAMNSYFERRYALVHGITGTLNAHQKHEALEQSKEMGLFLRLKQDFDGNDKHEFGDREQAWQKVATYRPEEIIHMLRLRWPEDDTMLDRLRNMNKTIFAKNNGGPTGFNDVVDYDTFKQEFGAALHAVREQGFRPESKIRTTMTQDEKDAIRKRGPYQIDFETMKDSKGTVTDIRDALVEHLKAQYGGDVVKANQAADTIQSMYKSMKKFIHDDEILQQGQKIDAHGHPYQGITKNHFDEHYLFVHHYERAFVNDDALYDKLEDPTLGFDDPVVQQAFKGWTPLSKRWSISPASDGLVRNFNDIDDADKAIKAYHKFLDSPKLEEKMSAAKEAASYWKSINGNLDEAKAMRFTIIEYIAANNLPGFFDIMGIKNLPFEIPVTEAQKILGPHAEPLTQEERRHMFNELRQYLVGSIKTALEAEEARLAQEIHEIRRDATLSEGEKQGKIEHATHESHEKHKKIHDGAKKWEHAAKRALRVRAKDMVKLKAMGFFFAFIAFWVVEGGRLFGDTLKDGTGIGSSGHDGGH
ncbi:MAG: hypothetical protein KBD46_00535 [Candidatus Levybacteria bacterium]|nr:hypothetical protein [Candidatus Levybacteria bacterium]